MFNCIKMILNLFYLFSKQKLSKMKVISKSEFSKKF